MNTIKSIGLVGLAVSALFAAQAFATPATPPSNPGNCPMSTDQQSYPGPVCIAPYGVDGSNTGLNSILSGYDATTNPNGVFTTGSPSVDPWTQQVQTPLWSVAGSSGSVSTILLQIAGMANTYTFGIFDPNDINNKLAIFTNGTNGSQALLSVYSNGGYAVNLGTKFYFSTTNEFGFFLTTSDGHTYYSLPSANDDGIAHMVAYEGNNQGHIRDMNGLAGGLWQSSEYIQAWEDLPFGSSDLDYNDFVVLVESIHPVPEPATLGMFGLGVLLLGGFTVLRRRRSYQA